MKVITEETLEKFKANDNYTGHQLEVVYELIDVLQDIGSVHEENGQIIVDELRPMSDAPMDGSSVQLCTKSNTFIYGHNFGIANCKWVVPGIGSYNDDDFLGWIPGAIYRPKDGSWCVMLEFIVNDDGVVNIIDEAGESVGDIVRRNGVSRVSLQFSYSSSSGLRQIADKLDELNGVEK